MHGGTVFASLAFRAIKTGITNMKDADLEAPLTLFGMAQARRAL